VANRQPTDGLEAKEIRRRDAMSFTKRVQNTFHEAMDTVQDLMRYGKSESTRLNASRIIIERIVPTVSSVESTQVNKETINKETMTKEQMISRLRALAENNPEIMSQILADTAKGKGGPKEVPIEEVERKVS
jgi:hypothetical protein